MSSASARGIGAAALTVTVVFFAASDGRCSESRGVTSASIGAGTSRGTSRAVRRALRSCCASVVGARQPKLSPPTWMVNTVRWINNEMPIPHSRPRLALACMSCAMARVSVMAAVKVKEQYFYGFVGAVLPRWAARPSSNRGGTAPTESHPGRDANFKSVCGSALADRAWC